VDYIVKPYDHVVLLSKVLAFLELDRRRMEIEERSRRLEEVVDERTGELRRVNERLVREIADRKNAEQEVRDLNEHLEELVRQRTAQLETVNTELEAFAYSVSHDLRAPLRAVEGFSQALLEDYADVLDDQGRDYLGRVSTEARRMAALIHDLLVLSRVTRATMSWEHVDLGATALRVVDGLRAGGEERSVDVRVEDGLEARGDPRLLGQAMENLVGNAWKFTSRTEGARIEVGSETRGGEHVYFVRDNGAGFDMEYAGKLFTPFQRLHAMHEFSGTGVGLSIVQRIVRRHGGRVWAEGVEGEGATFFFTLGDRPARTENTPGGRRPSDAPEGEP
jgi:light-regulated signal transduction histidine kinase (bacteriophytochrome)